MTRKPKAGDLKRLLDLSDDLREALQEFEGEESTGEIRFHFSQGAVASMEIERVFPPGNRRSEDPARYEAFAFEKARHFITTKGNGRLSLSFSAGKLTGASSFQRFTKKGSSRP